MRDLNALIAGVENDLADGARLDAEHGVDSSEWVEVRRDDVLALLETARQHTGCHVAWISLGAGGFDRIREHLVGGGRD